MARLDGAHGSMRLGDDRLAVDNAQVARTQLRDRGPWETPDAFLSGKGAVGYGCARHVADVDAHKLWRYLT